jgi:hypothetical protein
VDGDTAVAPQADRDRNGNQFAGLRIQVPGPLPGATHRAISLDRLRAKLGKGANSGSNLLTVGVSNQTCAS